MSCAARFVIPPSLARHAKAAPSPFASASPVINTALDVWASTLASAAFKRLPRATNSSTQQSLSAISRNLGRLSILPGEIRFPLVPPIPVGARVAGGGGLGLYGRPLARSFPLMEMDPLETAIPVGARVAGGGGVGLY